MILLLPLIFLAIAPHEVHSRQARDCPTGWYNMITGEEESRVHACYQDQFCYEQYHHDGRIWRTCDNWYPQKCLEEGCKGDICCSMSGRIANTAPWFREPNTKTANATYPLDPSFRPRYRLARDCPWGTYAMDKGESSSGEVPCYEDQFCYERKDPYSNNVTRGCDNGDLDIPQECTGYGCNGTLCCSKNGSIAHTAPWFMHPITNAIYRPARDCVSEEYLMKTGQTIANAYVTACYEDQFCYEKLSGDRVVSRCDKHRECARHGCGSSMCCSKHGRITHTARWFKQSINTTKAMNKNETNVIYRPARDCRWGWWYPMKTDSAEPKDTEPCYDNQFCVEMENKYAKGHVFKGCDYRGWCSEHGCKDLPDVGTVCCSMSGRIADAPWLRQSNETNKAEIAKRAVTTTAERTETEPEMQTTSDAT